MNPQLQTISDFIQQNEKISAEEKEMLFKAIKKADNDLNISEFKLDRTEKVKRTTAILLEETIEELELKRKAVEESNTALHQTLDDLKSAQAQLIQAEKLASLGQLTAGIAHEIKNPLNFVNNFSELSIELLDEVFDDLTKSLNPESIELITETLRDVRSNLEKVHEHGTRADSIVRSMLMHSRGSTGKKEMVVLNNMLKENVNLAFHSMRANKKPINVVLDFDLDTDIHQVAIISEDFSRVVINLCNNAFDAMYEKLQSAQVHTQKDNNTSTDNQPQYLPKLKIKTSRKHDKIVIEFQDNGTGIPEDIKDKILQPFYTTKKGTEGTGLGLSITNDIIKAHGGQLKIETSEGEGTSFIISIPNI